MKISKTSSLLFSVLMVSVLLLSGCKTMGGFSSSDIPTPTEDYALMGASATYDKAQNLYELGRFEEAVEYFHQYNENYPDSHLYRVSLYYLAHSYQELEQYEQAKTLYNQIIADFEEGDFWVQQAKRRLEQIGS